MEIYLFHSLCRSQLWTYSRISLALPRKPPFSGIELETYTGMLLVSTLLSWIGKVVGRRVQRFSGDDPSSGADDELSVVYCSNESLTDKRPPLFFSSLAVKLQRKVRPIICFFRFHYRENNCFFRLSSIRNPRAPNRITTSVCSAGSIRSD